MRIFVYGYFWYKKVFLGRITLLSNFYFIYYLFIFANSSHCYVIPVWWKLGLEEIKIVMTSVYNCPFFCWIKCPFTRNNRQPASNSELYLSRIHTTCRLCKYNSLYTLHTAVCTYKIRIRRVVLQSRWTSGFTVSVHCVESLCLIQHCSYYSLLSPFPLSVLVCSSFSLDSQMSLPLLENMTSPLLSSFSKMGSLFSSQILIFPEIWYGMNFWPYTELYLCLFTWSVV